MLKHGILKNLTTPQVSEQLLLAQANADVCLKLLYKLHAHLPTSLTLVWSEGQEYICCDQQGRTIRLLIDKDIWQPISILMPFVRVSISTGNVTSA